jgi:pimeloyl-ACP methyl ester carboxylesterase
MTPYHSEVLGTSGSPLLLIPGGAASSKGFYPHLEQVLPDHRVVLVDRQGTGQAATRGPATLASGSAAYAEVLRGLDAGPALVVGQSLGGAMAVQFALDHPELVSGLVLVDPTPFNEPSVLKALKVTAPITFGLTDLPVVGGLLTKLMTLGSKVADDLAKASLDRMLASGELALTAKAVKTLPEEGADLTARLRTLDVPVVLLTADRKPTSKIRLAHDRLADALGGRVVTWPGAVHGEHWREPHKVNELVLSVLHEVESART